MGMKKLATYPRLQRRNTGYYLRAKVPGELVSIIKKHEIVKSLRTNDYREAVQRLQQVSVTVDAEFAEARQKLRPKAMDSLTDAEVTQMALLWFQRAERDELNSDLTGAPIDLDPGEWIAPDALPAPHKGLETEPGDTIKPTHKKIADRLLTDAGVTPDPDNGHYRMLSALIERAMIENAKRREARASGDQSAQTFDVLFNNVNATTTKTDQSEITLSQLINLYTTSPDRQGISQKTKNGYAVIFRLLNELFGPDKPVREINRSDCREVREVLTHLPANATKRFKGLSARQAANLAAEQGTPSITAGTANSYLNNLSALFNWAVNEDFMDRNPAINLRVSGEMRKKDKRAPFTTDQLRMIFKSDVFKGVKPKERKGRFYIPIIGLFSGLRVNEICQLMIDDVKRVDGVWCFRVTEDGEASDGGSKTVKTDAGERLVPVHPELVNIGFLDYHKAVKKADHNRLFPELKPGHDGYMSGPFSKWFSRHLTKIKAKTPRTSFHSFRHNFRDAMREAKIRPDIAKALGGWKSNNGDASEIYGSGFAPKTLHNELKKISYKSLGLKGFPRNEI